MDLQVVMCFVGTPDIVTTDFNPLYYGFKNNQFLRNGTYKV